MITDKKMDRTGLAGRHTLNFPITTATSQAALLVGAYTPGVAGNIERVSVMATAVTATITVDVQVGGVTVLTGAITPVAGTETAGTLSATLSARRFKSTDQIQVKYTSNGSGAATNLVVSVQIRGFPYAQDAAL